MNQETNKNFMVDIGVAPNFQIQDAMMMMMMILLRLNMSIAVIYIYIYIHTYICTVCSKEVSFCVFTFY